MADNLYDRCASLLRPERLFPASAVLGDKSLIPNERGIYGWWFKELAGLVPLDGTSAIAGHHLLYIGIAPRAPSKRGHLSSSNLRKRICSNHLATRIGSSTLRRTLAALLQENLGLEMQRISDQRQTMSRAHELLLTDWMEANAAISLMTCDNAWEIEDELLLAESPRLPLNVKGSRHEFKAELLAARKFGSRYAWATGRQPIVDVHNGDPTLSE